MKKLSILISIVLFLLINAQTIYAAENSSGSSAALMKPISIKSSDNRANFIEGFLEQYNSPLTSHASDFVKYANIYDIDWRLVAAISGVESTFGKQIPYDSYNAWGWGVYGENVIRFSSWDEGIKTVSEGLRKNYMDKWGARDVYEIGRFYAASQTWASRVVYFMQKLEEYKNQKMVNNLSISL